MSEIEKMYLLAGIRKGRMSDEDCTENCLDYECKNCRYSNYPPFTAEKQINLILFLANREIRISPTYISSGYYLNNLHKIKSSRNISTFENSLAQHINAIWQDLTPEEKQQVKGILE